MATQTQWESIPDVSEQTPLDEPIKVRFSGKDRARVRRGLHAALEDGCMEKAVARPAMSRQKTQIVLKTEEEVDAFLDELGYKAKHYVQQRVSEEVHNQLESSTSTESTEPTPPQEFLDRRENTDMDRFLDEVKSHTQDKMEDVWRDTVDYSKITWFWNPYLTRSAGRAYHGFNAIPDCADNQGSPYAIGLAPDYYYMHGKEALLEVARHEAIHQRQVLHPDADGKMGHGPDFKQWIDDMDTHRHCKSWSKKTYM